MLITTQLSAQDMTELTNELRNKIITYKNNNILPQMNTWKSDIDRSIKSEDLIKLNELRDRAYNLRLEGKKNFEAMKKEGFKENRDNKKKPENRDKNREQMKEIGKELKIIISNNEQYFHQLFADAKPILRNWRDEIEDIVDKWHDDNEEQIENALKNKEGKMKPMRQKMDKRIGGKKLAAARLLLYNGKDDEMDDEFLKNGIEDNVDENKITNYPNPFSEQTTIKFNLPESGNVKISIIDEYGKVIEEVQNSYMNKGEHTINYTPKRNMNKGLYFYRIESGYYKESGKLIYRK